MRGRPSESVAGCRGRGALVKQDDFGEVVSHACPSFFAGAGDRSRRIDRDGGRLGELGNGRVTSVTRDVVAARPVVL